MLNVRRRNCWSNAVSNNTYTALAFNFGPDEKNYYIIDEELFEILVTYLNEEE